MSTIQNLFHEYLSDGGKPQITSFRTHIEKLMRDEIKPLCGRSGKSSGGNDWRSEISNRFKGRGSKWCFVSLDEVEETLNRFDNEGIDTKDYRTWTQLAGKAWIRFSAPRLNNGVKVAAFELRTIQSTIDQPNQIHYIPIDQLDSTIDPLGTTPFSLKLENNIQIENDTDIEESIEVNLSEDDLLDVVTDQAQEVYEADIDLADSLDDLMDF